MKDLFFLLLLILTSQSAYGQGKVKPDLAVSNINPLLLLNDPEQVIRQSERSFEVIDEKFGDLKVHEFITIYNEEADASELVVYYDIDSKIKYIEANIYDANGNLVRKIKKDEYADYPIVSSSTLFSGYRYQQVALQHSSYPYTVELKYEKRIAGLEFATFPDWQPQGFGEAIERSNFLIKAPLDFKIQFKQENLKIEPEVQELKNKITRQWEVKMLPAIFPEGYDPEPFEVLPRLLTIPETFAVKQFEGRMSSWKEFGDFMNLLYEGRDQLPKETLAEVKDIIAKCGDSELEKINQLYSYLQGKMRYVSVQLGIGGWQPFEASYVAENSYGDCKALSNFMVSLLKVAGIKAYPAIIYRGYNPYPITEDFVMPDAFNHVVVYIPDHDYWLECTSNDYPPNYLGSDNYNRTTLLVTEEGGKLWATPKQDKNQNMETIEVSIKVDNSGSAEIIYKSQLKGEQHERFRYFDNNWSEEEQKKWVLKQVSIPNFSLSSFEISSESSAAMATYNYQGKSSKYISTAGKRIFIPINKVSSYTQIPDKDEDRFLKVVQKSDFQEEMIINIELPKEWSTESTPAEKKEYNTPFGIYALETEQMDNHLKIKRTIALNRYQGDPDVYGDFRKFYRNISRMEKSQLVMTRVIRP